MNNYYKYFSILLIAFIFFVFFKALKINNIYDTRDMVGKELDNFKIISFEEKIITNNDLKKNNFTLINFWASWCGPCRLEHKNLLELSKNKNLKLLGINFKDKKILANKYLNEMGNPYSYLASDIDGKKSIMFGIYGIPESILVNKELKILLKYIGPLSKKDVKEIVSKINEKI